MNIIPMTAEEALEYAPKAALLDFDGPITPDLIAALRDHLSYAISALAAVSAKLYEAEAAIVDLHTSNLELASLLQAASPGTSMSKANREKIHLQLVGGIDPEYGTQMSFDDVPSRKPIDVIDVDERRAEYGILPCRLCRSEHGPYAACAATTVEFRTDPGTYDANRGEIHRMLAEEIVAQFGDKSAANHSEGGTETSELPPERGTETDSAE